MSHHVTGAFSANEMEQMLEFRTSDAAEMRRFVLMRRLMHLTGGIIQHGPLAGFNLGALATWRESDNGPKLLGFYEQEVCDVLARVASARDVFIDLGGADGYYAVGLVAKNFYRESHCFELEESSRANIAHNAANNNVADRVHVYGAATPSFAKDLAARGVDFSRAAVLVDIEGAEFDVLTSECLQQLQRAHIIIELHEFLRPDGKERLQELLELAGNLFNVHTLTTGARDPSQIPALASGWNDTDRWLLCSESRATLMTWLYLEPKEAY
ncbi:FkbM family methyltransferase [Burkholderia stagnalis]|uniref:FkbM family methyltransferase n=1 Tax=Burkholderia stagnalis TaxID=1503054 RepID=UPI00075FBECA|nr:FkbM family methyltransferase [Burkholderia stagnalis]KWN83001.1 hypothetical protein WT91_29580 [Burkholderia stagnalis]KWN96022.1 hypothetical protein WT92_16170 [Burkholderia stagnalis]